MESAFEKWLNSTVPGYREAWDAALEEAAKEFEQMGSMTSDPSKVRDHLDAAKFVRELKEQK